MVHCDDMTPWPADATEAVQRLMNEADALRRQLRQAEAERNHNQRIVSCITDIVEAYEHEIPDGVRGIIDRATWLILNRATLRADRDRADAQAFTAQTECDRFKAALEKIKDDGWDLSAKQMSDVAASALLPPSTAAPGQRLQQEVAVWAESMPFGQYDIAKILKSLQNEARELMLAVDAGHDPRTILVEVADIRLTAYHLAARTDQDADQITVDKFNECRHERTWEVGSDGMVHHVAAPGQSGETEAHCDNSGTCHPHDEHANGGIESCQYCGKELIFVDGEWKTWDHDYVAPTPVASPIPLHIRATYQPGGPVPATADPIEGQARAMLRAQKEQASE